MKNIINATVTIAKKTYSKLNISEFEKGQLSMLTHVGQKNHVRWDVPNLKKLSDAQRSIRLACRNGACLFIDGDYFVRL